MNYPTELAYRLTRAGYLVTISRYPITGYYEIWREAPGEFGTYWQKTIFDTGREAWAAYKRNEAK